MFAAIAIAVGVLIASLEGCGLFLPKAPDERALARGAVLATAAAVKEADEACARYGTATKDLALLKACEAHYDAARISLIGTGSAVDLWDRVETRGSVPCALRQALAELEQIAQDLEARGSHPPDLIADALALANALPRCADGL